MLPTGCDSLITLHLTVNKLSKTALRDSIYAGNGFYKYNFVIPVQNKTGILRDSFVVQNRHGCDSLVVLLLSVLSPQVVIPEGFSPNGDGINDVFVIKNLELYPNNRILIFNRWGNTVFTAAPYRNNWDGRTNAGDLLPAGTYFYILNLGDGSKEKTGYVFLAR